VVDTVNRPAGASPEETRALLVLDQLPGVGLRTIRAAVEGFGSAVAAVSAPRARLVALLGAEAARALGDSALHRAVDDGLAAATRLDMSTLPWGDPAYPEGLLRLADPPPVLFLRGRTELLGAGGVAVVGARRCTTRAKDVAHRLAVALGRAGVPVVSGMALGVDAQAHRGALDASGATVAVVGRGADAPYPPSNRGLFERLVAHGLVVSEFLPGTPPRPHHFPRRNRIMAALADLLVVVEAGRRSGALITVEHALDLGRDVWSVPGPIDAPVCAGSNLLLAEGALPLVSIGGFVARVTAEREGGQSGAGASPDRGTRPGEGGGATPRVRGQGDLFGRPVPEPTQGGRRAVRGAGSGPVGAWTPDATPEGDTERRILSTLGGGPLHVDQLAIQAGLDVPVALAVLVQLELEGVVEQLPGFLFRAA